MTCNEKLNDKEMPFFGSTKQPFFKKLQKYKISFFHAQYF
jgi:hypothetical protein